MVWLMLRSSVNGSIGSDVTGPLCDMARQSAVAEELRGTRMKTTAA